MVELIVIMVIIGALAAFMLPRLVGTGETAGIVFGDRVVSALRLAQKTAVGHRRLVCVTTSASALTLRVAPANTASPACSVSLAGTPDSEFANTDSAVSLSGPATLVGTTLYVQPNGDITGDAAGATPVSGNITVQVQGSTSRTITIDGATGYVE